jgi:hypothetical protein
MDPEIRRLFVETVAALEAVLVTMQLELGDGDKKDLEFAKVEALRRIVELRKAVERESES